jgi:hypothetical protein
MCFAVFVLAMSLSFRAAPALGHEIRPAYLQIEEVADHRYTVLWKQPVMGEVAVHLVPHLSGHWLERQPDIEQLTSSFAIMRWQIVSDNDSGIEGQTVSIEGLENTITDALVVVHAGGTSWQTLLTPSRATQRIDLHRAQPTLALPLFVELGITHILTGADHLLFILGLLLILRDRWMLLKTLTAFTVAHSITLALATLRFVQLPVSWVNAEIALSILFLASETVRAYRGGTSFTLRHPWIVAFMFGLLHGFGFASGLTAAGLPPHDIPAALLLFNVGVEIGQLAFVGLLLWLVHAFRVLKIRWPKPLELLPGYAVGTIGAIWSAQRVAVLILGAS